MFLLFRSNYPMGAELILFLVVFHPQSQRHSLFMNISFSILYPQIQFSQINRKTLSWNLSSKVERAILLCQIVKSATYPNSLAFDEINFASLYSFVSSKIFTFQLGFVRKRSTALQLLNFLVYICMQ